MTKQDYGKLIFSMDNKEIYERNKRNFLLVVAITVVITLLFVGGSLYVYFAGNTSWEVSGVPIMLFLTIPLSLYFIVYLIRFLLRTYKFDYLRFDKLVTNVYEGGFVINQGKPLELGFDTVKSIRLVEEERKGKKELIVYTIELVTLEDKTYILAENGQNGSIPVTTGIKTLSSKLIMAFDIYKKNNINE